MPTDTTSPILDDQSSDGNSYYYDKGFRDELEALFPYILNSGVNYATITIENATLIQSSGDFYRICAKKSGLGRAYWWIMLRLNGMTSPTEFVGDRITEQVIVPDPTYFDSLLQTYLTNNNVSI